MYNFDNQRCRFYELFLCTKQEGHYFAGSFVLAFKHIEVFECV